MYATPPANCHYHASRPAAAYCMACGRPVCVGCTQADQAGRPICRPCCLQYGIPQRRSGGVTALAVLNIVFGALGLLTLCSLIWLAMPASMMSGDMKIIMSSATYRTSLLASVVEGTITGIFLLICGAGLLKLRDWARKGSIIYAVFCLIWTAANTLIAFAWIYPEFESAGVSALQMTTIKISVSFAVLLAAAYPIVLLSILSRPMIKVQFGHQLPSGAPGGIPMPNNNLRK